MQINKNSAKPLFPFTFSRKWCIIIKLQMATIIYGGIAQLARVLGSYPIGRWFKSYCRYQVRALSQDCDNAFWPVGQEVKTSPFHGGIMGSIPVRVTIQQSHRWLRIAVCGFSLFSKMPSAPCQPLIIKNSHLDCVLLFAQPQGVSSLQLFFYSHRQTRRFFFRLVIDFFNFCGAWLRYA